MGPQDQGSKELFSWSLVSKPQSVGFVVQRERVFFACMLDAPAEQVGVTEAGTGKSLN